MSAEVYRCSERKKSLLYINNRARGIWYFLLDRFESLSLDRMIYEVNLMRSEMEHIAESNYL